MQDEQTGTRTKAFFVSSGHLKPCFEQAHCAVPISVGQRYHEDQKFLSTIQLVNKHFKSCTFIVCDTLQRHTLQIYQPHLTDHQAFDLAIEQGADWYQRNKQAINALEIPYEIMHWAHWLQQPDFKIQLGLLESVCQQLANFKLIFNRTAQTFTNRIIARIPELQRMRDFIFEQSLIYLKEECAVYPLWLEQQFDFVLYPGRYLPTGALNYDYFIKPSHPDLLRYVRINFKAITTYFAEEASYSDFINLVSRFS